MPARFVAYLRGLARRRQIGAEVDDELRFHLEQEIEANLARGMSPAEARRIGAARPRRRGPDPRGGARRPHDLAGLGLARRPTRRPRTLGRAGLHGRRPRRPDPQHRRLDRHLLGRRRRHPARVAVRRGRSARRRRRAQRAGRVRRARGTSSRRRTFSTGVPSRTCSPVWPPSSTSASASIGKVSKGLRRFERRW